MSHFKKALRKKAVEKQPAPPAREELKEYPATTESNKMARAARERVNQMSDEEVEQRVSAAMAHVYGGRAAQIPA